MQDAFVTPLATVLLLGILIFVHELGHYLVAKLLGVKVLRFSIGFGPPVFSFRRGETEYRVAWIPLGGYVKMAGDDPTGEIAPEDRGRGFLEQSPWKRLLISLAGPVMNLLLPLVLFVGLFVSMNGDQVSAAVVGAVAPGSPAAAAGLQPDDRILAVTSPEGEKRAIRDFDDLVEKVAPHPGQPLTLEVERAGQVLPPIAVKTTADVEEDGLETVERGKLGVSGTYGPARVAPVSPGAAGPLEPFDLVVSVGGAPVRNAPELSRALAAAGCGPVELEVLRERPRKLPGAFLADYTRERLEAVPTCVDGTPSIRSADPFRTPMIAAVEPGGPADRAGVRRGDIVTAVNGKPVHNTLELEKVLLQEFANLGLGALTLGDGRTVSVKPDAITVTHQVTGKKRTFPTLRLFAGGAGPVDWAALAVPKTTRQRTIPEVVVLAADSTVAQIRTLVIGIVKLVSGEIDSSQVGSLIQIVTETGRAVERGLAYFIFFMAFISVNLGIMNLLPIPVLDGGHIAQAVVESITRRPLSLRMREIANVVGLILLVSLMLFAFHNDIRRLFRGDATSAEEVQR